MILQASSSRKESYARFLADARNEVELLTPIPVVIPNAVRNLKKCISNFKEWVELPEHDIQAVMQLQLISPTGRTLAGTETNETLRKGGALFSNKL